MVEHGWCTKLCRAIENPCLRSACYFQLRALQSREKRGGFGCLGCGGEDRLFVGLQQDKPGREILRVIRARLAGDTQVGAEEGGSEFGDLSGQIDDQTPKEDGVLSIRPRA
jgi:hypothetical protein